MSESAPYLHSLQKKKKEKGLRGPQRQSSGSTRDFAYEEEEMDNDPPRQEEEGEQEFVDVTDVDRPLTGGNPIVWHTDELVYKPPFVPATEDAIAGLEARTVEDEEKGACMVCLTDFEAAEKLRVLPCTHAFHEECILVWLRVSGICPLCRHQLPG